MVEHKDGLGCSIINGSSWKQLKTMWLYNFMHYVNIWGGGGGGGDSTLRI